MKHVTAPTPIKTCETCQLWGGRDSVYDEHIRRCHAVYQYHESTEWDDDGNIRKLLPEHDKHLAFVKDADDYFAMLLTRANFGCVQHKSK